MDEHDRLVHDDAVIELRQYTLQPGRREELERLFDREFVEPQEMVGMHVIGQFRDLDDDDRYVWLRGFPSMAARAASLDAFYTGPVWQRHRDAANATMIDSDNVLLLRPARAGSGFRAAPAARAAVDGARNQRSLYVAGICSLNSPAEEGFTDLFDTAFAPLLRASGAELVATYLTDPSPNTFPRLPVREGERVFVWFARYADEDHWARATRALNEDPRWRDTLVEAMLGDLTAAPTMLRLGPTVRSELGDAGRVGATTDAGRDNDAEAELAYAV
ncbi:NIPSNAP family protein [Lysobacter silvisoli]|uniref:NIPSNAP family protein n=2 Tax=Lysobacter silvisoli TaxID=2293254 RepID=A0A371JYU8_9GAMM|nr:NIPSNAP family protein [Lysobacter silvisoli]